jgi:cytochrome c peroxidase
MAKEFRIGKRLSLNLPRGVLLELPKSVARIGRRRRRAIAIFALIVASLQLPAAPSQSFDQLSESIGTTTPEPITPTPEATPIDALKSELGKRLFNDARLSHDNSHSCSSCHDLDANGATRNVHDACIDGSNVSVNTLTVFNAALNFRFGWEGKFRTLESQAKASLESPLVMGTNVSEVVEKLKQDPNIRRAFVKAYGRGPNAVDLLDAIANFERTLVTPDSRFDRWLAGEATALSAEELNGYRLFKSMGCVSCHQGVNVGGNLLERHGIFHPLASAHPEILRVPSLRNVATTAPYFHDGSAPTLDDAVRKMAAAQLDSALTDQQANLIVAYLKTLTGKYRGMLVGAPP